jgi:hypothetical protein
MDPDLSNPEAQNISQMVETDQAIAHAANRAMAPMTPSETNATGYRSHR